jgi:hypothetical protein
VGKSRRTRTCAINACLATRRVCNSANSTVNRFISLRLASSAAIFADNDAFIVDLSSSSILRKKKKKKKNSKAKKKNFFFYNGCVGNFGVSDRQRRQQRRCVISNSSNNNNSNNNKYEKQCEWRKTTTFVQSSGYWRLRSGVSLCVKSEVCGNSIFLKIFEW